MSDEQQQSQYDLAIAGGGINGCGIARDAARRGLKVLLCEANDLACATSSSSSKLIHGGLRYLENYEFRLVQESLRERERLLRIAPHVVRPMRFILPHDPGMRSAWMIKMGLFLYDQLARRDVLPASTSYDLRQRPESKNFNNPRRAFEYSDCWVDDARFVVLNAMDAREDGATIHTRTRLAAATVKNGHWQLELTGKHAGKVQAQVLVNATGPWASQTQALIMGNSNQKTTAGNRLVQGSHIVLPRLFEHDKAYIVQNRDRRVVFAIPYEHLFTLIGTTDREFTDDLEHVSITEDEIDYLLDVVAHTFNSKPTRDDVVWSYSGVRGLYDDGTTTTQQVTRDYFLKTATDPAPIVHVFGGKLTTYRRLAEKVVNTVTTWCPSDKLCTTGTASLPGGDFPVDGSAALVTKLQHSCAGLTDATAQRLIRAYGTLAWKVIGQHSNTDQLGRDFGAGLTEAEVDYLCQHEWALDATDILWRRSKLGLLLDQQAQVALTQAIAAH